jgi:hypothetical protein
MVSVVGRLIPVFFQEEAERSPTGIDILDFAGAGFDIEIRTANGAETFAIGPAKRRHWQSQQDGLTQDFAQVEDVMFIDQQSFILVFISCLKRLAGGEIDGGDESLFDLDVNRLLEGFQTTRALHDNGCVAGNQNKDAFIGPEKAGASPKRRNDVKSIVELVQF